MATDTTAIRYSSLLKIPNIRKTVDLPNIPEDEDRLLTINRAQKNALDLLLSKAIQYPTCKKCNKSVCGSGEVCSCSESAVVQREEQDFKANLEAADKSLSNLIGEPFRQSRNAYGFASSTVSASSLFFTFVAASTAIVISTLILLPVLSYGYVYYRGKREEEAINADMEAELFAKKVELYTSHAESVRTRVETVELKNAPITIQSSKPIAERPESKNENNSINLCDSKTALIQPYKEKRGIFGNPTSHFLVTTAQTMAMGALLIKLGALVALAAFAWWAVAVVAVGVGIYFGYKRYKHLARKREFETEMTKLSKQQQFWHSGSKKKSDQAEANSVRIDINGSNENNSTLKQPLLPPTPA